MEIKSKFSGLNISVAHYLAELMCDRKAKKEKKIIRDKFWHDDYWKKFYVDQIMAAHSLLKVYSEQAVLDAVNDKSVSWAYSLRIKNLHPIISECEKRIKRQAELAEQKKILDAKPKEEIVVPTIVEAPRKQVKKNNIISKLKDL